MDYSIIQSNGTEQNLMLHDMCFVQGPKKDEESSDDDLFAPGAGHFAFGDCACPCLLASLRTRSTSDNRLLLLSEQTTCWLVVRVSVQTFHMHSTWGPLQVTQHSSKTSTDLNPEAECLDTTTESG